MDSGTGFRLVRPVEGCQVSDRVALAPRLAAPWLAAVLEWARVVLALFRVLALAAAAPYLAAPESAVLVPSLAHRPPEALDVVTMGDSRERLGTIRQDKRDPVVLAVETAEWCLVSTWAEWALRVPPLALETEELNGGSSSSNALLREEQNHKNLS